MLTLTTSLVLFLSTVTASPDTVVSPTIIENQQIAEVATTTLSAVAPLPEAKTASSNTNDGVEAQVREYFAATPILAKVAYCESKFKQFTKTGEVMRGVVVEDVGVMQINEFFHKKTADKMGIDLHTLEGNLKYAQYLYDKQGTQPWSASKHCWSK